MIKNILSIIKPNELENYAKEISQHNFFEVFSEELNSIKLKNYSYFLYFSEKECTAYIEDYMLFLSKVYPETPFDRQNYFSVFDQFKAYLEKEDVYFKYKTVYGSMFVNPNADIEGNLGAKQFLSPDNLPIVQKQKYYFPFFEYLESKIKDSYADDNVVIEKLEAEDLMYIQEVFMDKISLKEPPFYLNPNNKTYKYARQMIVNNILPKLPTENAFVAYMKNSIVAIIFASEITNDKITLLIMTDIDYMDSSFVEVIKGIKILYKGKCKTIIVKNINRGIASSSLNTACTLAHFKTDYDNAENIDGYTQYNHKYIYDNQDEVPSFTVQNIVNFPTTSIK